MITNTGTFAGSTSTGYKLDGTFNWMAPVPPVTNPPVTPPVITPPVVTPPAPVPSGSWKAPVIEEWLMQWSSSGSPQARNLSSHVNVVNLAFLQGKAQPVGYGSQSQSSLTADLMALKARPNGCQVLAGLGGGGGNLDLSDPAGFAANVLAYSKSLGGTVTGIVWDYEQNFDTGAAFTISKTLAAAGFAIVCCPNGSTVDEYLQLAKLLQGAGILTRYGQQFYDSNVPLAAAESRIQQAIDFGIPVEKITVGMMIAGDSQHWSLATCIADMAAIKAKWSTIGGCYNWEAGRPQGAEWAAAMASILGTA